MKRLAVVAVAIGALTAPALAHASPPPIARPDPVTYPVRLDYSSPLPTIQPLERASITPSEIDLASLAYTNIDDLGGFLPAPIGVTALSSGGKVSSFTFPNRPGAPTTPADNGTGPGVAPPVPPTPENVVPPANQGFGGNSGSGDSTAGGPATHGHGGGSGSGTTTTRRPPPATTTTTTPTPTTATTTSTTTTAVTTTMIGGGGGGCRGGSCSPGSCGTPGLSIDSSIAGCTLSITTASPGDSVQETLTIRNTSGAPYTLSFEATGPNDNHLWQDLELAVYDPTGGAPTPPYPPLTSWLGSFHALTTLNPGQTVQYVLVLYLPTSAGNADQGESAVISFVWHAA